MTTDRALRAAAPAKVNLALHLTGLREDGYHLLESLVVFADVGDEIAVSPSDALMLAVDGPFAQGVPTDGRNLVLKAAERLRTLRGISTGAHIRLTKHLPHGGGIGGGSSDAAATLKILAQLWDTEPLSAEEALLLGADIPVCLSAPHATIMRGIGEDLTPAPFQPNGWLVLVNPRVVVPTGKVFALHDALYEFSPGLEDMHGVQDQEDFVTWLHGQRNDLTKVAREDSIAPEIGDILEQLSETALDADMSGSGSTCWGLYPDEATARTAATKIAQEHPKWWVQPARILP